MACIHAVLLMVCPLILNADTGSWPEFRGPTGDGQADAPIPLSWSESENVTWKTAIHGKGWSTPVVLGKQIWLTTATEDGKEMSVLCVDRGSGRILHDRVLIRNESPSPLGNPVNCYASPSPAIEPGRIFVTFGSYGTACLDTKTYKTLWERRDLPCNHFRGPASSVVLFEDLVILQHDGSDHQYLVALDKRTGKTRWRRPRSTDFGDLNANGKPIGDGDFRKGFNTPLIVEAAGRLQMISPGAKAAFAYDPRTGKELWTVRYPNHSSASRTVVDGNLAFINIGYSKAELWAVHVDRDGDVSGSGVAWKRLQKVPNPIIPVVVDGLLYMVTDRGIASCLEAKSGEPLWEDRLDGKFSASPIHVRGRIYFFDEKGKTIVIRAARTFEQLATNKLETGLMASPAIAGRELYLRTKTHLYRVEE